MTVRFVQYNYGDGRELPLLEVAQRIAGIIAVFSAFFIMISFGLFMYYVPLGIGIIPGIESPDLDAAGRAFYILGGTAPAILVYTVCYFFNLFTTVERY